MDFYPTSSVVAGDIIRFTEGVFGGSYRKPRFLGERTITAEVLRESYGADKQQHTFTLRIIESEGEQPMRADAQIRRKGRNIYRNGVYRLIWDDENKRREVADEKHARGDAARAAREERISGAFTI